MVDVLSTTWIEVAGVERIDVSNSSVSRTSNECSLKSAGLAAFDVFDHIAWANLSTIHPCESTLVTGAYLCSSYVLCAQISNALNYSGENRRFRSIDLSIGLINWKFSSLVLTLLFLGFATNGALIITNSISWVKWISMPC